MAKHIHFHFHDSALAGRLDAIENNTTALLTQGKKIMSDTTKLVASVAQIKVDSDAVKTAVEALLAAHASGDQAAIDQAVADLTSAHDSLQATISEASPPTPTPVV